MDLLVLLALHALQSGGRPAPQSPWLPTVSVVATLPENANPRLNISLDGRHVWYTLQNAGASKLFVDGRLVGIGLSEENVVPTSSGSVYVYRGETYGNSVTAVIDAASGEEAKTATGLPLELMDAWFRKGGDHQDLFATEDGLTSGKLAACITSAATASLSKISPGGDPYASAKRSRLENIIKNPSLLGLGQVLNRVPYAPLAIVGTGSETTFIISTGGFLMAPTQPAAQGDFSASCWASLTGKTILFLGADGNLYDQAGRHFKVTGGTYPQFTDGDRYVIAYNRDGGAFINLNGAERAIPEVTVGRYLRISADGRHYALSCTQYDRSVWVVDDRVLPATVLDGTTPYGAMYAPVILFDSSGRWVFPCTDPADSKKGLYVSAAGRLKGEAPDGYPTADNRYLVNAKFNYSTDSIDCILLDPTTGRWKTVLSKPIGISKSDEAKVHIYWSPFWAPGLGLTQTLTIWVKIEGGKIYRITWERH